MLYFELRPFLFSRRFSGRIFFGGEYRRGRAPGPVIVARGLGLGGSERVALLEKSPPFLEIFIWHGELSSVALAGHLWIV
jgi:hypothetical protein